MSASVYNLLTILGSTASGKTSLAAHFAYKHNGEIISADSRQVYKNMDIGTGKDREDYFIKGKKIPCHLIDIVEAGSKYNVYQYQNDFMPVFNDILKRKKLPVLCGGSGMYIEAIVKNYKLINVPVNKELRDQLEDKSMEKLTGILGSYKKLHATTDTCDKDRLIRALEIEIYYANHPGINQSKLDINSLIVGVNIDRNKRRKNITERLQKRLEEGMVEEVKQLLNKGIPAESLIYYGLEYKYITLYLTGRLNYDEMFTKLNTAIHQFAKRQMTWFRKMERDGFKINWIDANASINEKIEQIEQIIIC